MEIVKKRHGAFMCVGAHIDKLRFGKIAVPVGERLPFELIFKEEPRAVHAASGDRALDHKA